MAKKFNDMKQIIKEGGDNKEYLGRKLTGNYAHAETREKEGWLEWLNPSNHRWIRLCRWEG